MTSRFRKYARLFALAAFLGASPATAAPAPTEASLAADPTWIRLVHYEPDRSSPSGWRSAIHSPEFFAAGPAGAVDPEAELQSTLAAMRKAGSGDADGHALCRFPARRQWLAHRLGDAFAPARHACPKYEGWTRSNAVESVSIVFATGYLGNPASYYGHTLLKLNFEKDDGRTRLQDSSVNYGAILTGDDDPVSYILKGVFGGYEGGFSDIQYHFHNHNYGENELRDLWEYRLDLPPEAVSLIVGHAWEVLGQRYDYFFFRRNCAFRMAELVEVVEGLGVIPPDLPWTIPQALLQRLATAQFDGRPLVAEVVRHPSRQSRFHERYASLPVPEARLLSRIVQGEEPLDGPQLQALPLASQHAVLDGLIDYYQFIADPKERSTGRVHPIYAATLAARYRLPPGASTPRAPVPPPPHEGRAPSWIQAGWARGTGFGDAFTLRIRPAYYDPLDAGSGHVENAALAMGDLQLRSEGGDGIRVLRFDLVAIESVDPGVSGLPGDRGRAWKLRAGMDSLRPGCEDCLVPRAQGDIGVGRRPLPGVFVAAFVGGAVQEDRGGEGIGFVRASAELILRPDPGFGLRLGYEHRAPVRASESPYGLAHLEARVALGPRHDLRVRVERGDATMSSVGIGMYW